MQILEQKDISFFPNSIADPSGNVFEFEGCIYRVIWNPNDAELFKRIIAAPFYQELIKIGLIETKITKDICVENAALILEHKKISYHTLPGELTDSQFWECCNLIINLFITLNKYGYSLKDAHPWNVFFHRGKPVFVDFASITDTPIDINSWYNEFYLYCRFPIFLASSRTFKKFAWNYRRENSIGVGLQIAKNKIVYKLFHILNKKPKTASVESFLNNLSKSLLKRKPSKYNKEIWTNYIQADDDDVLNPKTIKDKFALEILSQFKPKTVLDAAANKGFFAEMAAIMGSKVIAFDYEQACVDACNSLAITKNHDITAVLMDFKHPLPNSDIGLSIPDAFSRFRSELIIALGLVHHLCITQHFPVKLYCNMCMQYSTKGVLMEYIYPDDIHVSNWNTEIPNDYSLQHFTNYFKPKYPKYIKSQLLTDGGIKRLFIYYYND